MKNFQSRKNVIILSTILVMLFILAQFIFRQTGYTGPWCNPALGTTNELGHPMYQFVDYGFPSPALDILTNICAEPPSTSYEWLPIGIGIDGVLLVLFAYPLWARFLKKKSTN